MASSSAHRPLANLKQALREARAERFLCQHRHASTATHSPARIPPPSMSSPVQRPVDFHPGNSYRGHREQALQFRRLIVPPHARAIKKICPDPIAALTASQLSLLDPRGIRSKLFAQDNKDRLQPGDVVLVRQANADPVSGVVLSIRRRTPIDTSILLRNQLTRVGVEVWVKVYSPNVTGIEIVQRKEKRARRARLYYLRQPRHDIGSVEGVVRNYLSQRTTSAQNRKRTGGGGGGQKKGKR